MTAVRAAVATRPPASHARGQVVGNSADTGDRRGDAKNGSPARADIFGGNRVIRVGGWSPVGSISGGVYPTCTTWGRQSGSACSIN